MGVIKSGHIRTPQPIVFNFDDLEAQGSRYLADIRREAATILAQARREAEEIKAAAKTQGYQEGLAAAQRQAKEALAQEVAQRLSSLLPALQQALTELHTARLALLESWEQSCLHVALEIARRIIRRELSRQPEIPCRWIREALELAAGSPVIEIHLHPGDAELLAPQIDKLGTEVAGAAKLSVVQDNDIEPGGCRISTRFGRIDAGLEAQLRRLEEELQ